MNRIFVNEHGVTPGTDVTAALYDLFQSYPTDTQFVFTPGDYLFSPHPQFAFDYRISNSDILPQRKLGIWLRNMKNIRIDFAGARLWFSGQMQPITIDHCEDIVLKNAVIDWKKPLVAEGIVTAVGEKYLDLYVDPQRFPHRLQDGWLWFDVGNDEWYPLHKWSHIQFDQASRTVRRQSGDRFVPTGITHLRDSVYRFAAEDVENTAVGNIFALRHNARTHAGAFCEKSERVTLSDITFHSCGGLGCLAQFSKDLTFRRVHFLPNTQAGRNIVNGRDDGMHITCCSGLVTITECAFAGLMDDPVNVHGCCVPAVQVVDGRTLRCRYAHPQARGFFYWAEAGDTINFIERRHMTSLGTATAASYCLEDLDTFTITFDAPLPDSLLQQMGDPQAVALDNLTHTAAFTCTKNRFGSGRARGVLVSTPKPVRIEENYFASSGSAILLAGDSNYWFESGECHDVEIRNNVFTDVCLTSPYGFTKGVISICPVVSEPVTSLPYHKNVRITDNIFDTADTPVLYAFSCEGLTFAHNRIFRSPAAERWMDISALIRLEHCRLAAIADNSWVGIFGIQGLETAACEEVHQTDFPL